MGTPHILLNSGIGDSEALSAVGVKPIVNLPDVGENMMDHPVIANPWTVNGNDTFERIRDPANFDALFQQWQTQGTGPFVDTVASFIGFHRVGVKLEKDLTAGPNTAHYEHLFAVRQSLVRNLLSSDFLSTEWPRCAKPSCASERVILWHRYRRRIPCISGFYQIEL